MSKIFNKSYKFKIECLREEGKQATGATEGILHSNFQYNHQ